jgi:L-threonylcarbamoyladenylate synthase
MGELIRLAETGLQEAVERAMEAVESDGLIIIPTETVYGLAGRVSEPVARRLFKLKQRDEGRPLPIIGASLEALQGCVAAIHPVVEALARRFWPGPLTLVVPRAATLPDIVTGGRDSVGVRVPDHPFTLVLLERLGQPMIATSANMSDVDPATALDELDRRLIDGVACVVDAGPCPMRRASTVFDLTASPPRVLRAGPIPEAALLETWRDWQRQLQ